MFRAWPWLLVAVLTLVAMLLALPQQAPGLVWNVGKVTLGIWIGYWADRTLFPYARPDQPREGLSPNTAMLRRAILVAAVVIGLGLGV